jgi:hypothetical protein
MTKAVTYAILESRLGVVVRFEFLHANGTDKTDVESGNGSEKETSQA